MNTTNLIIPGENDYFMTEAINVLRTNILFSGQDVKSIVLTSCLPNEGKTVISLHVGKALAELGKKVLIIDADMRKSVMVGRNSDAKNVKGLSEVLSNQAPLQDTIFGTQYKNLFILFAGQFPPNPVDLLNSSYFSALIDAVKQSFDYIVIDSPPLDLVIDSAVVASKCDCAIMVIGQGRVKKKQAQSVLEQLNKAGCKTYAVLNDTDGAKKSGYYKKYSYKKYGYRKYGYREYK